MIGFLVAARQWPEVQEALTSAFRLFQERKGAVSEGIKVNQGEIFPEKEAAQEEMEGSRTDCGDEPSPPRRRWFPDRRCAKPAVCGARRDENLAKLNQIKVNQGENFSEKEAAQEEAEGSWTDCGDEPSPPRSRRFPDSLGAKPAVGEARRDGNLAKLNPIKVDQGEILKNKGTETEPAGFPRSWKNSQPQSACYAGKVCPAPSGTDSTSFGLHSAPIHLEGQRGKSELIGLNWGEIFYPGREGRGRGGSAGAKDSLIKHDMQGSNPTGHEINFLRTCVQVGAN